jgi:dipeptidyl aminopeptidase/acylaminoacyl peptidase
MKIISDSLLAVWEVDNSRGFPREYRVLNFRTQANARVVYTRTRTTGFAQPSFSAGGSWIAVREQTMAGENRLVALTSLAGGATKTLTLPFAIWRGGDNPWISPDGRELIVAEAPAPYTVITLHRVDVATGRTTRLTTLNATAEGFLDYVISPDGRSVAFVTVGVERTKFYDVDLSALLRR